MDNPLQLVVIAILAVGVLFLGSAILKSIIKPKKLDSITKLIKSGKYSAAEKLAKAVIAREPRNYLAHYYLGKAYIADKKNELALMEYKVVNQNAIFDAKIPETEFRKQLSQLYLKFNQNDEALKEFLLLTKLEPTNAENYYNCGKIYEQKSRADSALGFYQKAIQLNRRHVKAHAAMGLLLFRAKQFAEAKKEIDLAISLSPQTYSSYYYLGKILKENKDYPGAVNAFEKALRDPEFKQRALLERGSCYMMAKSFDNALAEFDRAVKASKDEKAQETLYARYFLASCYERNRDIDKAIEQWQIIYQHNHSFRDVAAKLSEYRDLQSNDSLKEFLTCSQEEFIEICKKVAMSGFSMAAQKIDSTKWGCIMTCTEQKSDDWMNVRKQTYLLIFSRDTDAIEDSAIRKFLDMSKQANCTKAIVFASAGFTSSASGFAENRPIELVGKEKLERILDKAGI
ncbi:tetratricopeptide repeat protein [Treponema pectinovorum]|uniref:tetratricopeptide repeat protein n=1 Tax=Treponema pectinovorum TaxID=164 RepID=UPI0011C8FA65|nr:tetratricopeptide repeat protein [Treponema pectinovorum]